MSRQSLPAEINSDNGSNFHGAKNNLTDLYQLLQLETTKSYIKTYLLAQRMQWQCIPAGITFWWPLGSCSKSARYHLRPAPRDYDFEVFSTLAAQVEACLNSLPIVSMSSHSDGRFPCSYSWLGKATLRPSFLPSPHFAGGTCVNR